MFGRCWAHFLQSFEMRITELKLVIFDRMLNKATQFEDENISRMTFLLRGDEKKVSSTDWQ